MRGSRMRSLLTTDAVTAGLVAAGMSAAQDKSFVILDDEESIEHVIGFLTNGSAIASVENDDVYEDRDADAALHIESVGGDFQKFNTQIDDWAFQVVANPTAADEYRYITFAWKKSGGTGMQLQIHGQPAEWGHRYHAGVNMQGWNPSLEVTPDFPEDWQLHTRDLFEDWDEFVLTGLAFSPGSLDFAIYDHIALHQAPEDPFAPLAVDAKGKAAAVWAEIKQDVR